MVRSDLGHDLGVDPKNSRVKPGSILKAIEILKISDQTRQSPAHVWGEVYTAYNIPTLFVLLQLKVFKPLAYLKVEKQALPHLAFQENAQPLFSIGVLYKCISSCTHFVVCI